MYYLDEENFSLIREIDYLIDLATKYYYYYYYCANCEVSLKNVLHFALINETKTVCFYQKKRYD